jgi:hypothetical protein
MSQKVSRNTGVTITSVHIFFSVAQTPCILQVITRRSEAQMLCCSWRHVPRSRALNLVTHKQQYLPSYLVICSFHLIYSFAAAILFTRMFLPSYLLVCSRHLTFPKVAVILFNFMYSWLFSSLLISSECLSVCPSVQYNNLIVAKTINIKINFGSL